MLFPTAECIVCSKSDNPTKKCRISDILSVRPIMNHIGDICRCYVVIDTGRFSGKVNNSTPQIEALLEKFHSALRAEM